MGPAARARPGQSHSEQCLGQHRGRPIRNHHAASLRLRRLSAHHLPATNGSLGLSTNGFAYVAAYFPATGFTGTDTFTFAAYNGYNNSTLATGTVAVGRGSGPIAPSMTSQPVRPDCHRRGQRQL